MTTNKAKRSYLTLARLIVGVFFVIGFLFSTNLASAAILKISPASGSYKVGDSIAVYLLVDSQGQAMNAVDAVVSFSSDKLEVSSISKEGSIVDLWAQEPSFSNSTAKVELSGIVLNPGYTGSSGRIARVNFKVKSTGSANVTIASGSVLANDGKGTNILSSLVPAQFTISPAVVSPPKPATTPNSKEIPVFQTPTAPTEPEIIYITQKVTEPFFSPEVLAFLSRVWKWLLVCLIVALLLLLLVLLYYIVVRVWHRILLFRDKLKYEARELSTSKYMSLRARADEDFTTGNYQNALFAYKKLQELSSSDKQAELSEKINQTSKFLIAFENFKKARSLALRGRWKEASILLEDADVATDNNFAFRADFLKLSEDVENRLAQEIQGKEVQEEIIENKLEEAHKLIQENKDKWMEEHSALLAERQLRAEKESEIKRLSTEIDVKRESYQREFADLQNKMKEKEEALTRAMSLAENTFQNKEDSLRENARALEQRIEEYKQKLSEVTALLEDAKLKLSQSNTNLATHMAREKELENQIAKHSVVIADKDAMLGDLRLQIQRGEEELKQERALLASEKEKLVNLAKDEEKFGALLREKELAIEDIKSQKDAEIHKISEEKERIQKDIDSRISQALAEGKKREESLAQELEKVHSRAKEQEESLKKSIEEFEKEKSKLSAKITELESALKSTKSDLADMQKELATEKAKAENLLGAISKFISPNK